MNGPRSVIVAALLALVPTACAKQVSLSVTLSVTACTDGISPPSPSPISGVGDLRFVVSVSGQRQQVFDVNFGADAVTMPELPFDQPLEIDVYGLKTASSTLVLAYGSSGTFLIPSATAPSTVSVNIALLPVDSFSGTPQFASQNCSTMVNPRAYHAQALLSDGRVLIYGGVQFPAVGGTASADWSELLGMPDNQSGLSYVATAEIFDPTTGLLSTAGNFNGTSQDSAQRSFPFLAASMALDGGAILVGGELQGANGIGGTPGGALFSPTNGGTWAAYGSSLGAHGHGCLASDTTGQSLVAGGLDSVGFTYGSIDSLNLDRWPPTDSLSTPDSSAVVTARADLACSGLQGILGATFGGLILEAGGYMLGADGGDGGFSLTTEGSSALDIALVAGPRTRAKAAAITANNVTGSDTATDGVLIAGGMTCDVPANGSVCTPTLISDAGQLGAAIANYFPQSMAPTELIAFPVTSGSGGESAFPVAVPGPSLPTARVDNCTISLGDGRVLVLGGLGVYTDGGFGTMSDAFTFTPSTENGAGEPVSGPSIAAVTNPLRQPRAGMACTLLHDGSVLVTGGYQTKGALSGSTQQLTTLNTVEVYRPVPLVLPRPDAG